MTQLPDCLYCRKDQRLNDLMIEVAPLGVSTLYLFKEQTYRGRCVVAYRDHVNELFELPDAELNYGAYSDKLPHLHVHLVPKYTDGPSWGTTFMMMPDPKVLLPDAEYATLSAKIRAAL